MNDEVRKIITEALVEFGGIDGLVGKLRDSVEQLRKCGDVPDWLIAYGEDLIAELEGDDAQSTLH